MKNKVYTVLKENMMLKEELQRLVNLIQENEAKHKGFRLVEDAFITSESVAEMDKKALAYMEEIFEIDRAALFIDEDAVNVGKPLPGTCIRVAFVNEKVLRYAYVDKRPYFGTYLEGLISDFHMIPDIGSYLIAPIIENGKIIASLNLYSTNPSKLSGDAHVDFVQELVLRIGMTLRKLHNSAAVLYQSQYDFLTGVYNKGMMHSLLHQYIDRYKSSGEGFAFVLMDMDNFKTLNDTHGHITGDETLRNVADGIKKLLTPAETLGRFGGDEFYMLLDTVSPAAVKELFLRIVVLIDEIAGRFNMVGDLGISGGFISIPDDMDPSAFDAIDIVKAADIGLYHSKVSGKRICSAKTEC